MKNITITHQETISEEELNNRIAYIDATIAQFQQNIQTLQQQKAILENHKAK